MVVYFRNLKLDLQYMFFSRVTVSKEQGMNSVRSKFIGNTNFFLIVKMTDERK